MEAECEVLKEEHGPSQSIDLQGKYGWVIEMGGTATARSSLTPLTDFGIEYSLISHYMVS